jgi:hypothetical protein
MPNVESATGGQKPRSNAWQSAVTVVQEAQPPFIPAGAHAMTIVIEFPPAIRAPLRTGTTGRPSATCWPERWVFELEGEPARAVRAGEAFWELGGDVIHYQAGNNRDDMPVRFTAPCSASQASHAHPRGRGRARPAEEPAGPAHELTAGSALTPSHPRTERRRTCRSLSSAAPGSSDRRSSRS